MYGLILIAVIAVMGGAIAYIGDRLGTKVGKKKLSIFGLRPKHTSIVVTIITGILIAATTLGVLSLASRDVRTALFGMEALKNQLSILSQEVSDKNQELEASRAALDAKNKEYSALNEKIKDTAAKLTAITQELDEVTAERDRAAAELQEVQAAYAQAQGDLGKAQQEIQTLQATKNALDARVAALNTAKATLQQDVDRLNDLTANLKKGIQVVREGTVVFRAGEVLSSTVIPAGQSKSEIDKELNNFIYSTNRSIADKLGITEPNAEVLWVARDDYDQAVSLLTSANEDVVVRISSAGNTIYGEPVISRFEMFPNRLVYNRGELVYTKVTDAGRDAHQAEEAVISFLQQVNGEAIKRGVLPDPIQGTVGVMSGSQLYDTINKVKRLGGKVELTAVASTDVHTIGPLQIEIQVRSVPNN